MKDERKKTSGAVMDTGGFYGAQGCPFKWAAPNRYIRTGWQKLKIAFAAALDGRGARGCKRGGFIFRTL
jgi:hypothetical protein